MGEGLLQMSCFPNALRPISYAFIDSVDIHHIFIISNCNRWLYEVSSIYHVIHF